LKNKLGGLNWTLEPIYFKPPQASETSQPTKFGEFGGGLDELEAHGDGVIQLHALAIATPLLFFLFSFFVLQVFLLLLLPSYICCLLL